MTVRWAAAAAAVVSAGLAAGAPAVDAQETDVTFAVPSGGLSLSAPATADLGTATPSLTGTTVSGQLGETIVTDLRGTLAGTWTVTVTASDFTTGGGGANERIGKENVSVFSGIATTTGVGAVVPTTALNAAGDGGTLVSATAIIGSMSATYNPTVEVTVPPAAVAGTYAGTITQTVL